MVALQSAKNLMQVVVPARAYSALRRIARQRRIRGRPFPLVVDGPQSGVTLNCCVRAGTYFGDFLPPLYRCRPALVTATLPNDGWMAEYLTPLRYRPGKRIAENVVLACR